MSHCFRPSRRGAARFLVFGLMGVLAAAIAWIGSPANVFGQAASKGKGAEKAPDITADATKATETDEPQPQQLDAKLLIGDAVDDADSPQYRKVTQAIDRFRERRVKDARDLLMEARTTHPQLPPAEVLIAKLFIVFRQPQLALAELEQAVRRTDKDPEAYLMLADGSLSEQRITAAEALYQKADTLLKGFNENTKRKENFEKRVLNGLSAVAEGRQQWAAAESLLRKLIKLDAKNVNAHQRLGKVLFQQAPLGNAANAKLKESYDEFVAAVKVDPKSIQPDVAMGQLFEQAAQEAQAAGDNNKFKDYRERATTFFERATRPQTADLNSLLAAASWALQTNQFGIAKQYAEAAMNKDPDSLEAKLVRALVARFSGDMATAERFLNDAFLDSPANFGVSNQLALVLIESPQKQKKDRALQLAELNYQRAQNNAEAASTLGWVYYKLNRDNEAQRLLGAVVNSRQISPDAAYYVARMLKDQSKVNEAIQVLQEALANPQPFANRTNATNLLKELQDKGETPASINSKDDAKDAKSSGSKRDTSETKSPTKSKGTK